MHENNRGIGARRHEQIVFQLALVAVVDEVDVGIEGVIAKAEVVGNVRMPVFRF